MLSVSLTPKLIQIGNYAAIEYEDTDGYTKHAAYLDAGGHREEVQLTDAAKGRYNYLVRFAVWSQYFPPDSKEMPIKVTVVRTGEADGSAATSTLTLEGTTAVLPKLDVRVAPVNTLPAQFNGAYIRTLSGARFTFKTSAFAPATIAKIQRKSYNGWDDIKGESFEITKVGTAGRSSETFRAVDSRGYIVEKTAEFDVIPYDRPWVSWNLGKLECFRCLPNGEASPAGTSLRIQAGRAYSKIEINGKQENFCVLRYRIKKKGSAFSSWEDLIPASSVGNDGADKIVPDLVPDVRSEYEVQIGVLDTVRSENFYVTRIPTDLVPLHLGEGGKNIGIGRYCDYSHTYGVDIGWKIFASGGLHQAVIFDDHKGEGLAPNRMLEKIFPGADATPLLDATVVLCFFGMKNKNDPEKSDWQVAILTREESSVPQDEVDRYSEFDGLITLNVGNPSGAGADFRPYRIRLYDYPDGHFFQTFPEDLTIRMKSLQVLF